MRKNSISFLVDTNAPENGSDDINGENGEIMHMNGVNGTVAHRNGAPEVNRMPPQVRFGYTLHAEQSFSEFVAGTMFLAYKVLKVVTHNSFFVQNTFLHP